MPHMQQKLLLLKHHKRGVFSEFGKKMRIFLDKYLIGPIRQRTLTLATYATKPTVAETSQKWRVFRVWNKNENLGGNYLIGPTQVRTLTRATYATKPSVAETSQKWRVSISISISMLTAYN